MPGTEVFGEEERREVMEVLETGVLFRYGHEGQRRGRWKAKEFEAEVSRYTGATHALAVSSGSAAVACALAASGVGQGDVVIVPPFTFIATIEAVLAAGALPVFADLDDTLCLSPEGIRRAVTPDTKAVLLVHMCGAAADIEGIQEVCREHDLILIEDAGQALGAFHHGTAVGRFGVAGAYSFDFFKIATCGEGGVVVTERETAYRTADAFADHGHTHVGDNRGMEPHPILGFNYRISELHAAVGLVQMRKLPAIREANRRHHHALRERLADVPGITFRRVPDPEGDSGTFLNLFLPSREAAERAVAECAHAGVPGVNYWFRNMYHFINQWDHLKDLKAAAPLAVHRVQAPQDYHRLELPGAQEWIGRLLSVGIRCRWSDAERTTVGDALAGAVRRALAS